MARRSTVARVFLILAVGLVSSSPIATAYSSTCLNARKM